ncbi:MAG: hypothetical protein WBG73_13480 [Coleofasciculaceae cyanobacterium]
MKTIGFKKLSLLLGAATLMLGFNEPKVQAQTVANTNEPATTPSLLDNKTLNTPTNEAQVSLSEANAATIPALVQSQPLPGTTATPSAVFRTQPANTVAPLAQAQETSPGNSRPDVIVPSTPTPTTPGTFTPSTPTPMEETPAPGTFTPSTPTPTAPFDTTPAQTPGTRVITPGRATSSGSSYVGVGGNIGLGDGDTAIGEGSFAILSKIGLTRNFSVRPAALFGDNVTIMLPVTYDFRFGEGPTEELGFTAAPFVGAGAAISTGDDSSVDLLLTGGIDVPLGSQFTATASVNASVTGNVAVGLLLGVGYNFNGF